MRWHPDAMDALMEAGDTSGVSYDALTLSLAPWERDRVRAPMRIR